ncbi:MAG: 4Fe-4S dicluster domain-containing protein [Proteobacteria bacterium]|nr:4Fe-4S dicluster domain-containing protein [Pseudomonadota bacterium]
MKQLAKHIQKQKISILINGRNTEASLHEPLLQVAKRIGIDIPTLCHHDDLEPVGACRLCLVEVRKNRRQEIVTACNYPSEDGIEVFTHSDRVVSLRRAVLNLLAARCPDSDVIRAMAEKHGRTIKYKPLTDESKCIVCYLCTRVCNTYATSAIDMMNRGYKKSVGTPAGEPPLDCVGCGACAAICPTGHIECKQNSGKLTVWDSEFSLAVCGVDETRCQGCGACEEACPFSVPRVVLLKDGASAAKIDINACRGCGVCVAACPSGAIDQPRSDRRVPPITQAKDSGRALVIACTRSNLGLPSSPRLPDGVELIESACSGGVGPAMLLAGLAHGYDGILVLGRHQSTCRLNGAEDHARAVVDRVDRLAQLSGLGSGRVDFAECAPGQGGPLETVSRFLSKLKPTPLKTRLSGDVPADSLDDALNILEWLTDRDEIEPSSKQWLASKGLPIAEPGKPALLAAAIPYFDILLHELLRPYSLVSVLVDSLDVLKELGIEAGVAIGGFRTGEERLALKLNNSKLFSLCSGCGKRAAQSGAEVETLHDLLCNDGFKTKSASVKEPVAVESDNKMLRGVLEALGRKAVDVGPSPTMGTEIALTPSERSVFEQRLIRAETAGAAAMLATSPLDLVRHLMVCRTGSWRRTHIEPVLACGLALGRTQTGRTGR